MTYPPNVRLYICDDYANTTCTSLNSWAANNNITNATLFSNSAINMMDYGSTGMPKAVVIGGPNHTVFYNANNSFNPTALQNAIDQAMNVTGIKEGELNVHSLSAYPSPAQEQLTVNFMAKKLSEVSITVFDMQGRSLGNLYDGQASAGENNIRLTLPSCPDGIYLLKVSSEGNSQFMNIVIAR
jgi:hypothetical protein